MKSKVSGPRGRLGAFVTSPVSTVRGYMSNERAHVHVYTLYILHLLTTVFTVQEATRKPHHAILTHAQVEHVTPVRSIYYTPL